MGGRDAEMTFGLGTITYTELYDAERTIAAGMSPNGAVNLTHLASDAAADIELDTLVDGETYIVTSLGTSTGITGDATADIIIAGSDATSPITVGTGSLLPLEVVIWMCLVEI